MFHFFGTVADHLDAEIRSTKEGDFIRNRQYREDLGDLLTLQAKLFVLVDSMDNMLNGKREHAEKHFPLFEEFMDHQVEWFRRMNQGKQNVLEYRMFLCFACLRRFSLVRGVLLLLVILHFSILICSWATTGSIVPNEEG